LRIEKMAKDWTGNESVRNCNKRRPDAEANDYYATEPRAVELLLDAETFSTNVWEPACGEGHISKVLIDHLYKVRSTDLIDRGYGTGGVDFLNSGADMWEGDIITNPPYKYAKEFVEEALRVVAPGHKVAMFLKLTFLEGQTRRDLFRQHPPKTVYVSSARLNCGKNGDFSNGGMVAYAWYVWVKGYVGPTYIKWIN
jgi:hypothetical protein